jgi:V/A-type H+/Na+-transporting ATPase subunit K
MKMTEMTLLSDVVTNSIFSILAAAQAVKPATGLLFLGQLGVAIMLGMAAVGSASGIGAAGQAAAGAWGKEGKAGKTLSFTYIILVSAPITQTLYAMIVMNKVNEVLKNPEIAAANAGVLLGIGLATGLGELLSAYFQGLIGAAGVRSLSESEGKGFAFILIALGIVETVGIFTMVFMLGMIPKLPV